MTKKYIYCAAIVTGSLLAGCVTSEDPFYQASDVTSDSNLPGNYAVPQGTAIWQVRAEPGKAGYYDISTTNADGSVQYQAALFKLGTNTFLDLFPTSIGCSGQATNASDMSFYQKISYQPLHMAVRVVIGTNSVSLGMLIKTGSALDAIESGIWDTRYYTNTPRMSPNTAAQRTFLSEYGGDTNVFPMGPVLTKTQ